MNRAQKIFRLLENDDPIKSQLQAYVAHDEKVASAWVKHTGGNENPKAIEAAKPSWLSKHPQFSSDDLFGRKQWGPAAKQHIENNMNNILQDTGSNWNKPSKTLLTWHIAHHMDHDVPFQKRILGEFEQHGFNRPEHPNYRQYQFLDDRVNVNTGQPEKYGTQAGTHINPT